MSAACDVASSNALLDQRAAAAELGLSVSTFRQVLLNPAERAPQGIIVGKRRYWRRTDLGAWLASKAATSEGGTPCA